MGVLKAAGSQIPRLPSQISSLTWGLSLASLECGAARDCLSLKGNTDAGGLLTLMPSSASPAPHLPLRSWLSKDRRRGLSLDLEREELLGFSKTASPLFLPHMSDILHL